LGIFIALNIFIYLIFIMLIIIFETVSSDSDSACPGRVASESDTDTQRIIRIVYRAVVSAIALLLAFLFSVVGGTIYAKVVLLAKKTGSSASGAKVSFLTSHVFSFERLTGNGENKVFWVGTVCAVCFTAHAIILLIFAATDWSSPYSIIFLIFIEVVPGVVMILVLSPTKLSTQRVRSMSTSITSMTSTLSTSSLKSSDSSDSNAAE
jgi:hypothetical protein